MNFMTVDNSRKSDRRVRLGNLFRDLEVEFTPVRPDIEISGISDDSRDVRAGDLFIAVPGHNLDGRKFISEALSLGATVVLTSADSRLSIDVPVIYSRNLREDIAAVADRFFDHPSTKLTVAGITGTNGKTTTSYMLAAIFGAAARGWGKIGTVGCDIGDRHIPLGNTTPGIISVQRYLAEMAGEGLSGCAMEVSSHALEQGRSLGIKFSSATFTNLTQDHLDYHGNLDSYFEAKSRLFRDVPLSVINIDDSYGRKLESTASGKIITFGTEEEAYVRYSCSAMDMNGSEMEFECGGSREKLTISQPGIFNQQNAAAATATAVGLGLSLRQAAEGLKKSGSVPGRMEPVRMGQPFAVFVDYAHTPDAFEKLLLSMRSFKPERLHIVFGCGGDRDRKKRPIMGRVASTLADHVYLTSDNPRTEDPGAIIQEVLRGIVDRRKCTVIEDRSTAIRTAVVKASAGDIIVIAGKGHEEYQVVGAIRRYFSDREIAESELRKRGYNGDD